MSPITHLCYADDMLIFTNGRLKSLRCLRKLMTHYEEDSGQKINLQKSSFYASKIFSQAALSKFNELQVFRRRICRLSIWENLFIRGDVRHHCSKKFLPNFATKFEGWHSRYLSFGGKITLIRSVLASLPIHIFSCMAIPKQVLRRMEGIIGAFLWSQRGSNRMNWVSLKKIC